VVETEAFKAWFGQSKVVDAAGRPLVVYHGTPDGDFDAFELTGQRDSGWLGRAIYFTRSRDLAKSFTGRHGGSEPGGRKRIFEVYLKVENPLHLADLTPEVLGEALQRMRERLGRDRMAPGKLDDYLADYRTAFASGNQVAMARDLKSLCDAANLARFLGHDAIMADFEGGTIAVFGPTQIKLAVGNKGTFDPSDPDFRR
jgi:hypothetical protein